MSEPREGGLWKCCFFITVPDFAKKPQPEAVGPTQTYGCVSYAPMLGCPQGMGKFQDRQAGPCLR